MVLETFGEDLLGWIEDDIEKKYQINNPKFLYNFKSFKTKNQIFDWINKILSQERFIKYKKGLNNIFELKDFSPDPKTKICLNLIKKSLETVAQRAHEQNREKPIFYTYSSKKIIYDKTEITKELIFHMRLWGQSAIWEDVDSISDPNPNKHRLIYNLVFHGQEIYFDLNSGFLELENKY
ncbi:hypothetical protein ACFLYH_03610 [Candidatus Dependentiae bacterium]